MLVLAHFYPKIKKTYCVIVIYNFGCKHPEQHASPLHNIYLIIHNYAGVPASFIVITVFLLLLLYIANHDNHIVMMNLQSAHT